MVTVPASTLNASSATPLDVRQHWTIRQKTADGDYPFISVSYRFQRIGSLVLACLLVVCVIAYASSTLCSSKKEHIGAWNVEMDVHLDELMRRGQGRRIKRYYARRSLDFFVERRSHAKDYIGVLSLAATSAKMRMAFFGRSFTKTATEALVEEAAPTIRLSTELGSDGNQRAACI
jgi:hypothetical protein